MTDRPNLPDEMVQAAAEVLRARFPASLGGGYALEAARIALRAAFAKLPECGWSGVTTYAWRVAFTEPERGWKPEGWDHDAATEHSEFAVIESSGDGWNEPCVNYFATDPADGRPYFRIPTKARRRYLSKTPASRLCALINQWPGLSATVECAPLGPWERA